MLPRSKDTPEHNEGFEAKLPAHLNVASTNPTTFSSSTSQPQAGPSNLRPSPFTSPMYYARQLSPDALIQNTQMLQTQNTRQPLCRSPPTVSAAAGMGIPEMGFPNMDTYTSSSQHPSFSSSTDHGALEAQPTTRSRARRKKVGEQQHIPRPMNSFMLFRANFVKTRKGHGLSKLASQAWKAMSEEEKRPWREEAKRVSEQHRRDHPHYQFRPVHKKKEEKERERELKGRGMQSGALTSPEMQRVSDSFAPGDPLYNRRPGPSWNTGSTEPSTSGERLASPYGAIPSLSFSHQEQRISTPRVSSGTPQARTLPVQEEFRQEFQNQSGDYSSCEQAAGHGSPFSSSAPLDVHGWVPSEDYSTLHPYHDPVNYLASASSTAALSLPAVSTSLTVPPTSPYSYSPSTLTATSVPTPGSVYNPVPSESPEPITESQRTWQSWAFLLQQKLRDPTTLAAQNLSEILDIEQVLANTGCLSPMTSPMLMMNDDFGVGLEQEEGQYKDDIGSLFERYGNYNS